MLNRMKAERMSQDLSQWQIAHMAGMAQGKLSLIERRLIEPTVEERDRLAKILGIPADTLFRPVIRSRKPQEEAVNV